MHQSPRNQRTCASRSAMTRALMRASIACTDLLPSPRSGIVLIHEQRLEPVQRAQRNPDAKPITPEQMQDIARLVGLRYWDLIAKREAA